MDDEFSQRFMRTIEGFVAVRRCNSCQQLEVYYRFSSYLTATDLYINDYTDGRGITIVFFSPTAVTKFQGNPSVGALNTWGWENFAIFDRNYHLFWKCTRYAHGYYAYKEFSQHT